MLWLEDPRLFFLYILRPEAGVLKVDKKIYELHNCVLVRYMQYAARAIKLP
jgi:hypothetical protein